MTPENKIDLNKISDPQFLKQLNNKQLKSLANDIREFIIDKVAKNGGHLSSNLGVVELTIALHKIFDAPSDKIFFDVGHQCYCHKILTGRANQFDSLRKLNGLSGFQKRSESIYDCFEAGHSSTALSAATGMAIARDLNNENYHVVPVIGDAALMSGMSFEALNHLGGIKNKVIIILNDNEMSISKSIGGFHKWISQKRSDWKYVKLKSGLKKFLLKIPLLGKAIFYLMGLVHALVRKVFLRPTLFNNLSLGYIGPIDGHNFKKLHKALKNAKAYPSSIVVHIKTQKGKGYQFSECDDQGHWHGVAPFYKFSGAVINQSQPSWSKAVADIIEEAMGKNERIIALTPAMVVGSELNNLFARFPDRCIDGGIAEEHIVTLSAGLALSGYIPVIFIYSSFLQRAYDQIVHDICRMRLKVIFIVDRAGLVGADGETHHGIFDASFLNDLPLIVSMAKNKSEVKGLIDTALSQELPFFIRLPRAKVVDQAQTVPMPVGKWIIEQEGSNGYLIATGAVINKLTAVAAQFDLTLINACYLNIVDHHLLSSLDLVNKKLFIYDIYSLKSALVNNIINFFHSEHHIFYLTLPAKFINQGRIEELLEQEAIAINHLTYLIKEKL